MEQNSNTTQTLISLKNFSFSYEDKKIFDSIDFTIESGYTYGIIGKNGAGKTSLLNILHGLQSMEESNVKLHPFNEITYIQTTPYFYPFMTGAEYLSIITQQNKKKIEEWNAIFNLPLNKYVQDYSTGMQKKLSILGGLALENKIMILDEPFNGLDLESTEMLHILIENMKQKNYTILLTSHIMETVLKHADIIYYINSNHKMIRYSKEEFQSLATLIKSEIHQSTSDKISSLL